MYLELNHKGPLTTCAQERITMCGIVPTAIMLIAADYGSVVGYAGIAVR